MKLLLLLLLMPLCGASRLRSSAADECGGHLCSGFAWYPVQVNELPVRFSARFDVPALPSAVDVSDPTFCHYIYFNVFFPNHAPTGGVYNQFVPQLVLGDALTGSTGPPHFSPQWGNYSTYHFSSQYFFALNTSSYPDPSYHAATGAIFPAVEGEELWTRMDLDVASLSWTLSMGVVGDVSRTSVVVVPQPFMGMLDPDASWGDAAYSAVHVNSCWELYGLTSPRNWPSSGSDYVMEVSTVTPGGIPWVTDWSNGQEINCRGKPDDVTWTEAHNDTTQRVDWSVLWKKM